ncbi:MAG: hypothetical protein KQH57_18615 [Actinomycetales bacterium]|nr:hypothetical protein [Actinomycetales bacterium]
MPTVVAIIIVQGYVAGAVRRVRERLPSDDAGLTTLEITIIALGLIAIAALLVVALTAAVQRRVDQIT